MLSVVIATKNRSDELAKGLESLFKQTIIPEVIVISDGSTDETSFIVKSVFTKVVFIEHSISKGYIVRRNEGISIANQPYVLSIDDDCILEDNTIIEQIIKFLNHSNNITSVAWPHRDVYKKNNNTQQAPDSDFWQIHSFKGCSFIVKKETFIKLGGFRECFIHQGEEEDYCLRLLDLGYPTLLANGTEISHYESLQRNWARMDFYGSRNLILFAFFNIPFPLNLIQAVASSLNSTLFGIKIKRPYQKIRGVLWGWLAAKKYTNRYRNPVTVENYRRYRFLKKNGPEKLSFENIIKK